MNIIQEKINNQTLVERPILKEFSHHYNYIKGTILWDLETTNLPQRNKPEQTAFIFQNQNGSIYCDNNFNVKEVLNLESRISSYSTPNPHSLLINKKTFNLDSGLTPYRMQLEKDSKDKQYFNQGPQAYFGWNSDSFDEIINRYNRYIALLNPYPTVQNKNLNCDAVKAMWMIINFDPSFKYAVSLKGNPLTNLGITAKYFGVDCFDAHDAIGDINAMRQIIIQIKKRYPLIYESLLINSSKKGTVDMLKKSKICLLGEFWMGPTVLSPITYITHGIENDLIVFNLRFNPKDLNQLSDAQLIKAFSKNPSKEKPIRLLKQNQTIPMIPFDSFDSSEELVSSEMGLNRDELFKRADYLLNDFQLINRIKKLYEIRKVKEKESYKNDFLMPEQKIYQGFPSRSDSEIMNLFHESSWRVKWQLVNKFQDERLREFARRLCCEHDFEHSSNVDQKWWKDFCEKRLHDDRYGLTHSEAILRTESLLNSDILEEEKHHLIRIHNFLLSRGESRLPF